MADDTFLLISRGVRYSPGVVFNPQMLPIIIDAAMTGVLVQHRSAMHEYCLAFFAELTLLELYTQPSAMLQATLFLLSQPAMA